MPRLPVTAIAVPLTLAPALGRAPNLFGANRWERTTASSIRPAAHSACQVRSLRTADRAEHGIARVPIAVRHRAAMMDDEREPVSIAAFIGDSQRVEVMLVTSACVLEPCHAVEARHPVTQESRSARIQPVRAVGALGLEWSRHPKPLRSASRQRV